MCSEWAESRSAMKVGLMVSSLSTKLMKLPVAFSSPALRAADWPAFFWWMTWTRWSFLA